MSHASTTRRAYRYGAHPQELRADSTREDMPRTPARLPRDYCKRIKGAHAYELDNVKTYPWQSYPYGYAGGRYMTGWTDYKEYRCVGCGKKRIDREETHLDNPVRQEAS